MTQIKIKRMSEIDETYRKEVAEVFVDAYYDALKSLSKDKERLIKAIEHVFVSDVFFVAFYEEKIAGILACSHQHQRALRFDKKVLRKYFGFIKGSLAYWIMDKEFHQKLPYSPHTTYIESVATSSKVRGKGIATALMNYVFHELPYEEYVLEVLDSNPHAKRLYENLGYREFKKEKEKYPKLTGFTYRFYMKKQKEKKE